MKNAESRAEIQLHGNRLSMAASSHSDTPQNWILPDPVIVAEKPALRRLQANLTAWRNPQPVGYQMLRVISYTEQLTFWLHYTATAALGNSEAKG